MPYMKKPASNRATAARRSMLAGPKSRATTARVPLVSKKAKPGAVGKGTVNRKLSAGAFGMSPTKAPTVAKKAKSGSTPRAMGGTIGYNLGGRKSATPKRRPR